MARGERRSDRMRSIETISNREAQNLAVRMERQAETLRDAEQRLVELREYLAGYAAQRAEKNLQSGVSAMQLTETHLFMERLREAVAMQERTVEKARSGYEACRASWIAQHVRTTALGSAVHRFEVEETRTILKREQSLQDEIAARYHKPRSED